MTSLYSNLLKYQETDKKSNLENFSTVILCDFLNRLDSEQTNTFFKNVLSVGVDSTHLINRSCKKEQNVTIVWRVHPSIDVKNHVKYPDIIGFIDHIPVVLIEVKIDAGFTYRVDTNETDEPTNIPQLEDYGKWLNEKNPEALIILLTSRTSPPIDFLTADSKYGIRNRKTITWNGISKWLKESFSNESEFFIAKDFRSFLLEQKMAIESPKSSDFSILETFVVSGVGLRIKQMMNEIRQQLKNKYGLIYKWKIEESCLKNGYDTDEKQNILWSWTFYNKADYGFIAWGIFYPDETDPWNWLKTFPSLPQVPFVFIGVFTKAKNFDKKYIGALKLKPDGWLWDDNAFNYNGVKILGIRYKPLSNLLSSDQDITQDFFDFIDSGFKEIGDFCRLLRD